MKTLIVDNEKNIRSLLKKLCKSYLGFVEVVGEAATIEESITIIERYDIELIFLDIQLDDGLGTDLLERIQNPTFQVIFITAYDQYAVKAFKYSAIDYLLKPIDPDDLVKAVHKALDNRKHRNDHLRLETLIKNISRPKNERLIINDNHSITAIDFADILYFAADGAYTHVFTQNQKITSTKNLKHYENLLDEASFFRCHHSHLVNLKHFEKYDKVLGVMYLTSKQEIPVSFRKREFLQDKLKEIYF